MMKIDRPHHSPTRMLYVIVSNDAVMLTSNGGQHRP
jgi:hypothetical protein